MSLLIVLADARPRDAALDHGAEQALAEAGQQGFLLAEEFHWPGGRVCWFPTPDQHRVGGAALRSGERWAALVGSVYWKGCSGQVLLQRLLSDDASPQQMPWDEFVGSFAMVLSNRTGIWCLNDALGLQKIYQTSDGRIASTSFMVCRATLRNAQVNRQRAQEYVLFGANHGAETPVRDVGIADPTLARRLDQYGVLTVHPPQRLRRACTFSSANHAVSSIASIINDSFADMLRAYGPDVGMALSGGFDSRLILAALDGLDVRPALYVYGGPADADVTVASTIAKSIGLPINCIDKQALDRTLPPLSAASLNECLRFFDGIPCDGALDRGSDRSTRLQQVQGGRLNLNGGGGEILRNFFYLPDRDFSAAQIVGTFYSNWRREVFKTDEEREDFAAMVADGILDCLGHESGTQMARNRRLPRSDVELTYTLFRLRYWMGRNNSIATRYGNFLTPLVQPNLVALCASIPLGWKGHGQLEAAIIRELSPRVAQGPSAYGFDFSTPPSFAYRSRVAATVHRPLAIRRRSAVIQHWLGRAKPVQTPRDWEAATADWQSPEWINRSALTEVDQLNRLFTIQAVLRGYP